MLYLEGSPQSLWEKCTTCTLKHGGGFLMFWGYMSYKSTGIFIKIDDNLHSSVWKLRTGSTWTFQRDNDSKHKAKSTIHWTEEEDKKVKVLEWPRQSSNLNIIELLRGNIRCALHARLPKKDPMALCFYYSRRMDNSTL